MQTVATQETAAETKKINKSQFVYVIYIRTTAEKLWDVLTQPELTKLYWNETWQESDWQKGSSWRLMIPDGRVGDSGQIEEIQKPKHLVIKWRNEFKPDLKTEGYSFCTINFEPTEDVVKLTLTHEIDHKDSKLIDAVSNGWPMILSSAKSLLEAGESLAATRKWPKGF